MLKHLGTFAVLAVCLFVLAMGDCDNNGGTTKPRVDPPIIDPPVTETPKLKFTGSYELVEARYPDGTIRRPPSLTGKMFLFALDSLRNTFSLTAADGDRIQVEFTWSTDETYFLDNAGNRMKYTWDGTHLNLTYSANGQSFVTSWRKN